MPPPVSSPIAPSLPHPTPCLSYWQRTTRAYPHLHSNRNTPLPTSIKYVVIGSGISGALTAFELTENGVEGKDIIILEAREAASGASSRNAGHVRPDAFRGFSHYSTLHSPTQALSILSNERLVLSRVNDFVKKHNVQCDFHPTTTYDVCMTPSFAAYEAAAYTSYKLAGGDVSHVKYYEGEEARTKTGIKGAVAACEWPAGSSHPAKLAQWSLSACVERGVGLYTHCPVSSVTGTRSAGLEEGKGKRWDVHTSRGIVSTETVIHCTNAYASLLLPQLSSVLTPNRAQAHSLIAPSPLSGDAALTSTYSLRYSLQHFYSLIQRRGDGTLILGVSRLNPTLSEETKEGSVTFDDSGFNEEVWRDALGQWGRLFLSSGTGAGEEGKDGLGVEEKGEKEAVKDEGEEGEGGKEKVELDCAWSGIVGMTGDGVPFIGEVEGMEGQWVCAGFGAHGMARIFTCAPGVAKLVLGGRWEDTGLPECFQFTKERVLKMSASSTAASKL